MDQSKKTVAVIMTVRNDADGCALTLDSLSRQSRVPDEIIVVDGGSTDRTPDVIRQHAETDARIRWIDAPGANIARGRNIAAAAANSEIIACTDSGCRAEPRWLERLCRPFEQDAGVDFVAGFYRIEPHTLLENVVGLATMRGQLDPVTPDRFNPSARSMACTKALWSRSGGWPEWLLFSEDTLFDEKVRRMEAGWRFVGDALVHWRPRPSLPAIAKQFYCYGTGRGHTQIGAADFRYNLRNAVLVLAAAALSLVTPWALILLSLLLGYFLVWTFHHKAVRIMRRTGRLAAYPLCLAVMWVVLAANLTGYLVGSWQRWRDRDRYQRRMALYLAGE